VTIVTAILGNYFCRQGWSIFMMTLWLFSAGLFVLTQHIAEGDGVDDGKNAHSQEKQK
jgi:hypothetical protein